MFGLVLLVTMSVAIVQIALFIYARNVVAAAAHEGARVAVERGSDESVAAEVVARAVRAGSGRLVDELSIDVRTVGERVQVLVRGNVRTVGPLPGTIPVTEMATALLFEDP